MEQQPRGSMMVTLLPRKNPIKEFCTKVKKFENGFQSWLTKQSIAVEAAVVAAGSSAQGAALGALLGKLSSLSAPLDMKQLQPSFNPQGAAALQQSLPVIGGPLVQARNFAVIAGVNAGISTVLRRLRGKEDTQSRMAAAFGSGTIFSLLGGTGRPRQPVHAVYSGLTFALFQGACSKVGQALKPAVDNREYVRVRDMLHDLGLQKYVKNFQRGLLTDNTLPLLTDSALRDTHIPPGPRLLILDRVQRLSGEGDVEESCA